MSKRGKASLAEITTPRVELIQAFQVPDAPYDLTDDQAEVWRQVANDPGLPPDWFTQKNFELLSMHSRHVIEAKRISKMIGNLMSSQEDLDVKLYDDLLRMQERESRAIMATMTQMRTTHQSLYDKKIKLSAKTIKKPWE
jgi:hypothetical protein